jgi:hypothetical protein
MATTLATRRAIYHSGTYEVRLLPEAASQSFHPGEFVELNANSQVNVCSTNDTTTIGIALGYASGVTNEECPVLLANEDTVFEMTISGASDPTFAAADAGVKLALLVANNRHYADVDDTDNDLFIILGLKQEADAGINIVGDDYVRGFVMVLPSCFQFGEGAESA